MRQIINYIKNMFNKSKSKNVRIIKADVMTYQPEFLYFMNLPYAEYIDFEEI